MVHLGLIDVALNVPLFRGTESIWIGTLWQALILAVLWASVKARGRREPEYRRRHVWAAVGLIAAYALVVTPFAGGEKERQGEEMDEWLEERLSTGWRRWVAYPEMEPKEARERLKQPHGAFEYVADDVVLLVVDEEQGRRFELVVDGEFFGERPLAEPDAEGVQRSEIRALGRTVRVAVLRGQWATVDMLPQAGDHASGP